MKSVVCDAAANQTQTRSARKPYRRPALKAFGKLHLRTETGSGNMTDLTNLMRKSDPRAKENIVRIGDHPAGIGLYLFDYKPEFRALWGHGRQFGVMADEAERVMPAAVSVGPDGYKVVDYALLGIHGSLH